MSYEVLGNMVTEARNLLDSIKGGAIRVMQTQFDVLKQQFTDKLNLVSVDLNTFVNQQKNNVNSIFTDPDNRYQKIEPVGFKINGDKDKFYPVVIGSAAISRLTTLYVGRNIHTDGDGSGGMYAKFTAIAPGWGVRPATLILEILKTNGGGDEVLLDGFIADYELKGTHPNGVILYLRGGYTYEMWCEGGRMNQVIFSQGKSADIPTNGAVVFENGYERTINGSTVELLVKTERNLTLVPNFKTYERV